MPIRHAKQFPYLRVLRDILKPVPMSETKEYAEYLSYHVPEAPDRFQIVRLQPVEGINEAIGQHEHGGLMKMGDQKEHKILVPKLFESRLSCG